MTRFVVKENPPVRISAESLIPERLAGLSTGEIEKLPLIVGNRTERVGDWFRVEAGKADRVEFEGPAERLDRIGGGMSAGGITVHGDAGAYLGIGMKGGEVTVAGSAGYGAATDLQDGTIRIGGNAGAGLGGALPGVAGGMKGGTVIVAGNAGDQAGQRLRRGLVVIGGDAGASCGSGMIAGTVVVGGKIGGYAGAGLLRGSIIALGGTERVVPTFADCGVHDLVFIRLLARHLASLGQGAIAARLGPLRRYAGDTALDGKGEILLPS